jgi:hypothetical protein
LQGRIVAAKFTHFSPNFPASHLRALYILYTVNIIKDLKFDTWKVFVPHFFYN